MTTRNSSATNPLSAVPMSNGGIARAACARARQAGIPLPPLLKGMEITIRDIDDSRTRLAARDQVKLLNQLADVIGDDLLGLHIAEAAELRDLGLLFYVMASSATLLEALQRAVRYSTLGNEGVAQRCIVGRHIQITLEYIGISRHLDRHQAECWMALIMRVLRQLCGRGVKAQRVRFVHARAHRSRELAAHFGGEVEFNAAADQITFSR